MKDPLEQESSPYEILEIPTDASQTEIDKALAKYLHARKKPDVGVKARHRLSNLVERLEIDLFSYPFEEIQAESLPAEEEPDIREYCEIPEPDTHEIFPDLCRSDYSAEFGPITYNDVSLDRTDAYDTPVKCDLEEEFDR